MAEDDNHPGGLRVFVLAALLDVSALLPVGLIGVLALELGSAVGFSPAGTGLLVAAFFATGSLFALTAGAYIDAAGMRRTVGASVLLTTLCSSAIATLGTQAPVLVIACALAGVSFALIQPSTNAVLGAFVREDRRIFAICGKQAAVPVAISLAAVLAPMVLTLGSWRLAFLFSAVLSATSGVVVVLTRFAGTDVGDPVSPPSTTSGRRSAQRAVMRYGLATLLASFLPGALTAFTAVSLSGVGLGASSIAVVIGLANVLGITVRLLSGYLAQRVALRSWLPVTAMMMVGGLGAFLLATGVQAWMIAGTFLAFGLGWGWSGLVYALVYVQHAGNPGATGAIIQAGGMGGTALGPLVIAVTVDSYGLSAGWIFAGAAIGLAGLIVAWRSTPGAGARVRGLGPVAGDVRRPVGL